MNNPKSKVSPSKFDFCYIVPLRSEAMHFFWNRTVGNSEFPMRPVPLKESGFDLQNYVCAKMEHISNTYRLYKMPGSKGVFRGKSENLVVEPIPKDDEFTKLEALLIFNEQEYDRTLKDWKDYWNWRKNRNESRYRPQEVGEIDYDSKNMSHCMRLIYSGRNIIENGEPIVRLEDDELKIVRDIRKGIYTYDEIMKMVEKEMDLLKKMKQKSDLPESVNTKKINKLYNELRNM